MGHGGERRDVADVELRVADGLGVHRFRARREPASKGIGIVGIDERDVDAELRERGCELRVRPAVERARGDDMVAVAAQREEGEHLRRHAGRSGERRAPAFQRRDSFLERRDGRVRDPRVDVAERLQVEEARRVVRAVEHERCRLVDRQRTRARRRIRDLPGVEAERVEAERAVRHGPPEAALCAGGNHGPPKRRCAPPPPGGERLGAAAVIMAPPKRRCAPLPPGASALGGPAALVGRPHARFFAVITPVFTPAQWSPPMIRACSILTQRFCTTSRPASLAIRAASSAPDAELHPQYLGALRHGGAREVRHLPRLAEAVDDVDRAGDRGNGRGSTSRRGSRSRLDYGNRAIPCSCMYFAAK